MLTESPNFIETLTSENNLAVVERGQVTLKCFAIGKPAPKIRWYRIDDTKGGFIRGSHPLTMQLFNLILSLKLDFNSFCRFELRIDQSHAQECEQKRKQ